MKNIEFGAYIAVLDALKQKLDTPHASLEQVTAFIQSTVEREALAKQVMESLQSRPDFIELFPNTGVNTVQYIQEVLDGLSHMNMAEIVAAEKTNKEQVLQKIDTSPESKSLLQKAMQTVASGFSFAKRHKWKILTGLGIAAGVAIWYYWDFLAGFALGAKGMLNEYMHKNAVDAAVQAYNIANPTVEFATVGHDIIFNGVSYSVQNPLDVQKLTDVLLVLKERIPGMNAVLRPDASSRATAEMALQAIWQKLELPTEQVLRVTSPILTD